MAPLSSTSSSSKHLPIEIIVEILLRLTTETLVRCMCVCKEWYSQIKNPCFISTHLERSSSNGKGYLLYLLPCHLRKRSFITYPEVSESEVPFECESWCCSIVGSFNGVLCLTDTYAPGRTIHICNPSIRKCRTIRSSSIPHRSITNMTLGFGYHRQINDYKVVRMMYFRYDDDPNNVDGHEAEIEVYTLGTNSWKGVACYFPWIMYDEISATLVNESLHWLAANGERGMKKLILAFDLGQEMFHEIMLPDYHVSGVRLKGSIAVFKESLSLFAYCPFKPTEGSDLCYLWVMNEYGVAESWTKQFTVVAEGRVSRSLGFTKRDELIVENSEREIVLYDFSNNQVKYLGVSEKSYELDFVPFINSLVLL